MTNPTKSFTANTYSSVQASAYQQGTGIASPATSATSAATSGNTTNSSIDTFMSLGLATAPRSLASCTTSITNLTVSSLEETVTFYTNVFGWEVEKMTEDHALLTNGASYVCAMTESYANKTYGFTVSSPFSTGNFPTVTTTLLCKDVTSVWDAAIASGATPVQSPATNPNKTTSATLIGPDNYVWVITNNSNMLI